jgi:tRNA nucleotidyltransferase (CCA-adding enzyme)
VPWQVYLVGGAVRDELLGRPVRERDWVVVGATAEELLSRGFRRVGRDFPVFLHPDTHEEHALARTERKTGAGHTGFECYAGADVTLEQDLARRDLTVNALARAEDGRLIDPHGGVRDLEARCLRHVSSAFVEDPLRVFRVARFAAELAPFGFRVAPETMSLMRDMVEQGALAELAAERVWHELVKALASPAPSRFFDVLDACSGLTRWFCELTPITGRLATVLDAASEPVGRFATIGWLVPPAALDTLCDRLKAPRQYRRLAGDIARFGKAIADWRALPPGQVLDALMACGAFRKPAEFARLLVLIEALSGATLEDLRARVDHMRELSPSHLQSRGLSGAALGAALRTARLEVLTDRA